jgi:hypothetical protein
VAPHASADCVAELIVDALPGAILAPGAKGLIGRLSMGQIMRHQAPSTTGAQPILDTIEHLSHGAFSESTTSLCRRQEGRQDVLLLLGQICGIGQAPGGHGRFSLRWQGQS